VRIISEMEGITLLRLSGVGGVFNLLGMFAPWKKGMFGSGVAIVAVGRADCWEVMVEFEAVRVADGRVRRRRGRELLCVSSSPSPESLD
jgi:hypothetical protein